MIEKIFKVTALNISTFLQNRKHYLKLLDMALFFRNSLTPPLIRTTLGTFPQELDHKRILDKPGLVCQFLGPNQRKARCSLEER